MKELYERPDMEVIVLEDISTSDLIGTSGDGNGLSWSTITGAGQ